MVGKWIADKYFRGYKDGDWVYWSLDPEEDVDLDSIGVWTGLLDKNGDKIYTGDIVYTAAFDNDGECYSEVMGVVGLSTVFSRYIIEENNGSWEFMDSGDVFEVLGNYYESEGKELLEKYTTSGLNNKKRKS